MLALPAPPTCSRQQQEKAAQTLPVQLSSLSLEGSSSQVTLGSIWWQTGTVLLHHVQIETG